MPQSKLLDSFHTRSKLDTQNGQVDYFSFKRLSQSGIADISSLPFTIKILVENALRNENGVEVVQADVEKLLHYDPASPANVEIPFAPARVLMQDFTGVPALVDLAALRSAMAAMGKDPARINPAIPVDLVIDHSVQVDRYGSADALAYNADLEFQRNRERYEFLHWGQKAFENLRVVPPASGICHQVNLEYLGKVVMSKDDLVYPDTLVGTDSHTPMINGLGILGWGVGGIEAEAALLGQPIFMLMPQVVGFRLTGKLAPGTTATDIVLTVTQILREKGVVGKFVEFFGPGLSSIALPDRATISNMAPEYGATCGFFPVDDQALLYMKHSGRTEEEIDLAERYCKEQGLFRTDTTPDPKFADVVELDLGQIEPSLAGPKRPQDRVAVKDLKDDFNAKLTASTKQQGFALSEEQVDQSADIVYSDGEKGELRHGDVAIAAITSCTNTSNPYVMLMAGVLAKKAVEAGLTVPPYVKTSLAPGSKVVTHYLDAAGLTPFLDALGFHTVGYGCTSCIGNSGPLADEIVKGIDENSLVMAGVLSGNRNFEGRINPHTRANYLTSPPLVVAYALAGTVDIDLESEPVGKGKDGNDVYLKDLWPNPDEVEKHLDAANDAEAFRAIYGQILTSNESWNAIPSADDAVYNWDNKSTYIQLPPFFVNMTDEAPPISSIENARALVMVGDSVTTDHISPAGAIAQDSPAGKYLQELGVANADFNSYGSRRGNDRVMTRGTFANIRLRNLLAPGTEGGWTTVFPENEVTSIFDASLRYKQQNIPCAVIAGKDYGMGSSRDWAAKGSYLLGIRFVLAESFERIHRSNLIGMGVLPLQFKPGENANSLHLTGSETFSVILDDNLKPQQEVPIEIKNSEGITTVMAICRLDTLVEVEYFRNGGILHTVLRNIAKAN